MKTTTASSSHYTTKQLITAFIISILIYCYYYFDFFISNLSSTKNNKYLIEKNKQVMASTTKNIFLVGATGGLGGHVLKGLLASTNVNFHITAYVRTPSKLNGDFGSNVKIVQGDLSTINAEHMKDCNILISTHSSGDNTRHVGYQNLVTAAKLANVSHIIGVGGAGQLLLPNGKIKQTDESFYPQMAPVTEDHEKGLQAVKDSGISFTWVAPPYMPNDMDSSGGVIPTNDDWNDSNVVPQIDVATFIVNEAIESKHAGHVVALKALEKKGN